MALFISGVNPLPPPNTPGIVIPKVVSFDIDDKEVIETLLSKEAGYRVRFYSGAREEKRRYLQLANNNAKNSLEAQQNQQKSVVARYIELENILQWDHTIQRMECFDISHTSGQQTVASCVVFNREGPLKTDYRRYNIDGITPGDDYAAMGQALNRRYGKIQEIDKIPDIILIDGGKGQLAQAEQCFEDWQYDKTPLLIGVAKGTTRKPGLETLILSGTHETIPMTADSTALHLIQHIRDESHRFAIAGHRNRRQKIKTTSSLESIPGIGAKRRQALLKYMGGLQGLKKASRDEIANVPGVSSDLADVIYDHLHS